MSILVQVGSPADVEGRVVTLRVTGDYAPDVFDDLASRAVDMYFDLFVIDDTPPTFGDDVEPLTMPLDPDDDTEDATA